MKLLLLDEWTPGSSPEPYSDEWEFLSDKEIEAKNAEAWSSEIDETGSFIESRSSDIEVGFRSSEIEEFGSSDIEV